MEEAYIELSLIKTLVWLNYYRTRETNRVNNTEAIGYVPRFLKPCASDERGI